MGKRRIKMRYKLLEEWDSKRHGKIFPKGTGVFITLKNEIDELIELGCIEKPKNKEVKKKKKIN